MALDVRADRVGHVVSAAGERAPRARYLPIAEHGLIGDLHTVALVGTDGTIDWYCCPRETSRSRKPWLLWIGWFANATTKHPGESRAGLARAKRRGRTL
jgi:hypothetical protein